MRIMAVGLLLLGAAVTTARAEMISGMCMVSAHHNTLKNTDTAELMLRRNDCDEDGHGCGSSDNSNLAWSRWTGVSMEALKQEGAQLNAHLTGEAGDLQCNGTVHDGVLGGRYQFQPNPAFLKTMAGLGFDEITPNKQQGFLMLDVNSAWVRQMKDAGVTDLTTSKLMGLRALHVDLDYIHAMTAAGYPELRAGKLTEMKAVGVTPEKVREAKELGFQPTQKELVEMCIFKIDRPFVERMRAKGMKDLTLAKLVKVKIFKLEE